MTTILDFLAKAFQGWASIPPPRGILPERRVCTAAELAAFDRIVRREWGDQATGDHGRPRR
ncbi:hypothetical protein [Amycolatopsis panacis]|uniref:hypothetical protein n=1 Tax=Amycolatopsis panacis TaxID=2340917 RepID=UPI0011C46388|nr:hypothetical protein [Amycolatopsis panacis]